MNGVYVLKIAVIGSRSIEKFNLDKFLPDGICEIISGGARGVDTLAAQYARERGIPLRVYSPDYRQHGKRAPIIRNRTIVDECDVLFAFWDGISPGTAYTVKYAHQKGKPIKLFRLKEEI